MRALRGILEGIVVRFRVVGREQGRDLSEWGTGTAVIPPAWL